MDEKYDVLPDKNVQLLGICCGVRRLKHFRMSRGWKINQLQGHHQHHRIVFLKQNYSQLFSTTQ